MAKISWKQLTYDIAQACRDALGNNEIIKVKDLPDTIRGFGSFSSTVEPREVTNGEITYNSEGRLIGSAPFTYEGYKKYADITSWSQIETGISAYWYSIAYGNGKFVAVDYDTNIAAWSEDGITWTKTELPVSANWLDIAYGNGKFAAITGGGYASNIAAWSEDGITWTQTEIPNANWIGVVYGNGKFVAISNTNNIAAYSTDGINWESIELPAEESWIDVAYGNGKFVAVAEGYQMRPTNIAAYSTDGITWEQTTMPLDDEWLAVAHDGSKFVAVTWSGIITYSEDGITWIQSDIEFPSLYSITYGNGRFIASIDMGLIAYTTNVIDGTNYKVLTNIEDGQSSINISTSPINIDSYAALGIIYGNGKYIIHSGSSILYSTDGNTWTEANYPVPEYTDDEYAEFLDNTVSYITFMDSAYTNGKFMITAEAVAAASGITGYMIYISEDGINWRYTWHTNISTITYDSSSNKIICGSSGSGGVNSFIRYSTDNGETWSESIISNDNDSVDFRCKVAANGDNIVAIYSKFIDNTQLNTNRVAYSNNGGETWTETTALPIVATWQSIAYGDGKFVAIAGHIFNSSQSNPYNPTNIAAYSTDGINWTQTELPISINSADIAYNNDKFVVVSGNNIIYSADGIKWSMIDSNSSASSIYPMEDKFVCASHTNITHIELVDIKILEEILLSATGCTDRTLTIVDNELVLDNMIIDKNAIL